MFNPLKMAGDIKGMEKMLKPALDLCKNLALLKSLN